jgi:hypothetical protein
MFTIFQDFLNYGSLCRHFTMNRAVLNPEYFIHVHSRHDLQYPAFLKMVEADDKQFEAYLEMIFKLDFE